MNFNGKAGEEYLKWLPTILEKFFTRSIFAKKTRTQFLSAYWNFQIYLFPFGVERFQPLQHKVKGRDQNPTQDFVENC